MLKHLTVAQVREIVSEAEKLNARHPPSQNGIRASDVTIDDLVDYENDAKELKRAIAALDHDGRMELMGLVWVGRGDTDDYDEAVRHAHRNSDEGDVHYIAEKSMSLPAYLKDGMKKIGLPSVQPA